MNLFLRKKKRISGRELSLSQFLARVNIFSDLNKRELKNLSLICYERKYSVNEIVFKQGYPNVVFYILKSGSLSVNLDKKKDIVEIVKIKPFEYIGEMGLFLDEKRTANVTVLEDSVLIAFSKEEFKKFIETYPRAGIKILYKFGEVLAKSLIKCNSLNESGQK